MEALSNEDISLSDLAPLECVVIQSMECRMLVPTPGDYIKLLLFFSNNERNFEDLTDRANNISLLAMLIYEISHHHPSVIALASLANSKLLLPSWIAFMMTDFAVFSVSCFVSTFFATSTRSLGLNLMFASVFSDLLR